MISPNILKIPRNSKIYITQYQWQFSAIMFLEVSWHKKKRKSGIAKEIVLKLLSLSLMITLDWKTIQQLETHLVDFKLVKNVYKLIYKPFYTS